MVLVLCKILFGIAMMKFHNYCGSLHHRDTDNNEFRNSLFTRVSRLPNLLLNFPSIANFTLEIKSKMLLNTCNINNKTRNFNSYFS